MKAMLYTFVGIAGSDADCRGSGGNLVRIGRNPFRLPVLLDRGLVMQGGDGETWIADPVSFGWDSSWRDARSVSRSCRRPYSRAHVGDPSRGAFASGFTGALAGLVGGRHRRRTMDAFAAKEAGAGFVQSGTRSESQSARRRGNNAPRFLRGSSACCRFPLFRYASAMQFTRYKSNIEP